VRKLHDNAAHFRARLTEFGVDFRNSPTVIFPIICGDDWAAFRLAHYCHMRGIYVQAIPYPVVTRGSARLRACVDVNHTKHDLDYCATMIRDGAESLGLIERPQEELEAVPSSAPGNGR